MKEECDETCPANKIDPWMTKLNEVELLCKKHKEELDAQFVKKIKSSPFNYQP